MTQEKPIRAACLLAACGMVVAACSDAGGTAKPRTSAQEASTRCSARTLESDLESDGPSGPAVDPATSTVKLESGVPYIVSSTYGVPKPGEGGAPTTEQYLQLFAAIEEQLQQQQGLLALQLGTSSSCRSGRTLAVWKSEEDMLRFVTSPAHMAAMRAVNEVLEPGYEVTHWTIVGGEPVDFRHAVEQLGRTF